MEHIVQFGVTIDDDAIQKHVADKASQAIMKELEKALFIDGTYYRKSEVEIMVDKRVDEHFSRLKDEIIAETAKQLTEKLWRTKQVKERVAKVLDDVMGD